MYQNRRGITGLPCLREARNCTSQRPPNISAPVSPISFQGDMCSPVQASQAIGAFIKSAPPAAVAAAVNSISDLLDRGALAARDQPRHSAQVADADQGAI